jgi:hypothetical protein
MIRLHNKKAKQLNKRVATYTFSYCLALPRAHKKASLLVEIANLPIYVRQKNIGRRRNFAGAFNFTNAIATM